VTTIRRRYGPDNILRVCVCIVPTAHNHGSVGGWVRCGLYLLRREKKRHRCTARDDHIFIAAIKVRARRTTVRRSADRARGIRRAPQHFGTIDFRGKRILQHNNNISIAILTTRGVDNIIVIQSGYFFSVMLTSRRFHALWI